MTLSLRGGGCRLVAVRHGAVSYWGFAGLAQRLPCTIAALRSIAVAGAAVAVAGAAGYTH